MKISRFIAPGVAIVLLLAPWTSAHAAHLSVPNYSFEIPNIGTNSPYAAPILDSWEESAQPSWYDPSFFDNTPWAYLVGTFYNVPDFSNSTATNTSSIDNCDGTQAAFLFAVPQVAIFQDYNSFGGTATNTNHAFNAVFNAGKAYKMTVGVIGGGGGMPSGSTLQLSLYYRDASNNMVSVATATVTNTPGNFPVTTHFVDFAVEVPTVKGTDPWAGQNIGIQLLATPDFADPSQWGGYWDVDNVRLTEDVFVPNFSFETPNIGTNSPYAAPILDSWQESAQPSYYDPAFFDGSPWSYLVGTFYNVPNFTNATSTNTSYIENGDAVQSAFLFAVPDVAIFQDYNSFGGTATNTTHAFNALFNAGKSYSLTVGVLGGGGGMPIGSTLVLSLYYRDASNNMVSVGSTTVTNTLASFPTNTHFVDFNVQVPAVKPTDPWAGKNIGIQLLATPDFEDPSQWGGYWDVDNVRLFETTGLNLVNAAVSTNHMRFTVQSDAGAVVQILATASLAVPTTNWSILGTLTNLTGADLWADPATATGQKFYAARPAR